MLQTSVATEMDKKISLLNKLKLNFSPEIEENLKKIKSMSNLNSERST